MQRKIIITLSIVVLLVMAYLYVDKILVNQIRDNIVVTLTTKEEDIQFLIDTYGVKREQIEDIDVHQLIRDYNLRKNTTTYKDSIDDLIMQEGQKDTGYSDIYKIIDVENGARLKKEDVIKSVAFYHEKDDVTARTYVFDFINKKYYCSTNSMPEINALTPHELTDEQINEINNLIESFNVYNLDAVNDSLDHKNALGIRLKWKLVIEREDGSICTYRGNRDNNDDYPANYCEFADGLELIAKQREP